MWPTSLQLGHLPMKEQSPSHLQKSLLWPTVPQIGQHKDDQQCWMPKFTTILALLWSWNILPNPDLLKAYRLYIYSGRILLSKVRLVRWKKVLLLWYFLVKCFTLDSGRPCDWHCLSRHMNEWMNRRIKKKKLDTQTLLFCPGKGKVKSEKW